MLVLQTPGRCSGRAVAPGGHFLWLHLLLEMVPLFCPSAPAPLPVRLGSWVFARLQFIVRVIGFLLAFPELALALWWWFEIQFGGGRELSLPVSFSCLLFLLSSQF